MRAKWIVRSLILLVCITLLTAFGILWRLQIIPRTQKELKVLFENNEWLKSMVLPAKAPPPPVLPDVYSPTPKKKLRRCNICSGGYLQKHKYADVIYKELRLPYFNEYHNCLTGEALFKTCSTTCLTLWIQDKNSINPNGYEGVAMACADGLIHYSEDIKGVGSPFQNEAIEFHCNRTYVNERSGFRITYEFVRADHADPKVLVKTLREAFVPRSFSTTTTTPAPEPIKTYYVYGILFGIFLIIFVLLFVCPVLCTKGVRLRNFPSSRCRNIFRKKSSGYTSLSQGFFNYDIGPGMYTEEEDVLLDWRNGGVSFHRNSSYAPPPPPPNMNEHDRSSSFLQVAPRPTMCISSPPSRDSNEHDGSSSFLQVVPSPTMSVPPPPPPRTVAYTPNRGSSSSIFRDGFEYTPMNLKLTKLANRTSAQLAPSRLHLPATPGSSMFESRLSPLTVVESKSKTAELMFKI